MAAKIKLGEDGKLRVADPRAAQGDPRPAPRSGDRRGDGGGACRRQRSSASKPSSTATVQPTDLYLAHFLGLKGATSFLRAMEKDPEQGAADLFPKAAAANKSIFYRADGSQRTLKEIYDRFEEPHDQRDGGL